jgi:hypothetical protein
MQYGGVYREQNIVDGGEMKHFRPIDFLTYAVWFILIVMSGFVALEWAYPWTIFKIHSFRMLTEGPVTAGDTVLYEVCYTKYLPIHGKVLVTLKNSITKTIKEVSADSGVGVYDGITNPCAVSYVTIPKAADEDVDYTIGWEVIYTPTKFSRDKVYRSERSKVFEIIDAPVKGQKGDPGKPGKDGKPGAPGAKGPGFWGK